MVVTVTYHYGDFRASMVFDTEDQILVGRVLDIEDLVAFHGETIAEWECNFHSAVDNYLAACQALHKSESLGLPHKTKCTTTKKTIKDPKPLKT